MKYQNLLSGEHKIKSEIAILPFVKMLRDVDEYSEFEAIFANSRE
jgi:hypothetical protein